MSWTRFRWQAWMIVTLLLFVLGCSKRNPVTPYGQNPHPVPSPDVRAVELHFLEPSIGFPDGWARGLKRSSQRYAEMGHVYLGQGGVPILGIEYAGRFPALNVVATIDGQSYYSGMTSLEANDGYLHWSTFSTLPWSPADTGTYVIAVTLDPNDAYPEVDETNNSDTMLVHVTEGNLSAAVIELSRPQGGTVVPADTVQVGTPITVTSRFSCGGAYPSFRLQLDENGTTLIDTLASCSSSGIFPGGEGIERTWFATAPGVHMFTLTLDPEDQLREETRNDNVARAFLVVVP